MSLHKEITIPLWLVIAAIVLPNLLPDLDTLSKAMPFVLEYKWILPVLRALIGVIVILVPYQIYQRYIYNEIICNLSQFKIDKTESNPFNNRHEFVLWRENVLPRLKFDKRIYNEFKFSSERTISLYKLGFQDPIESIKESISILDQAILLKEKQKITK